MGLLTGSKVTNEVTNPNVLIRNLESNAFLRSKAIGLAGENWVIQMRYVDRI